jgi:steroid 5-alpha reductase family enzyme
MQEARTSIPGLTTASGDATLVPSALQYYQIPVVSKELFNVTRRTKIENFVDNLWFVGPGE